MMVMLMLIVAVMATVMASIRSNGGRRVDGRGGTSVLSEDLQRGQKLPLKNIYISGATLRTGFDVLIGLDISGWCEVYIPCGAKRSSLQNMEDAVAQGKL